MGVGDIDRRRGWRWRWAWLSVYVAAWAGLASAAEPPAEPVADTTRPMTPGTHWLTFDYQYEGRTEPMPYALYLPPNIEQAAARGRKLPLVVSLSGRGGLGLNFDKVHAESPIGLVRRYRDFAREVDYMLLRPMGPPDVGWDNDRVSGYVAEAVTRVMQHYPVDEKAVHLIGMSLGGEGVWHVASKTPGRYATIAAISGRQHPDPAAVAEAVDGATVLIAVGGADGPFTRGSRQMAEAMREAKVDLIYLEIPGKRHGLFAQYFHRPAMYHWLVKHRLGEPAPDDAADATALRTWAYTPPGDPRYDRFSKKLQEQFSDFKRYWHVDNCAMSGAVGLREDLYGRDRLFITQPFNADVPCRIMFTTTIRADRNTTLELEVGHEPESSWQLVVNVRNEPLLKQRIGPGPDADSPWRTFKVDLSDYAGEEVFIELLNAEGDQPSHRALWSRIELID